MPSLAEAQQNAQEALAALVAAWKAETNATDGDAAEAVVCATADAFLFAVEASGLAPHVDLDRGLDAIRETVGSTFEADAEEQDDGEDDAEDDEEPSAMAKAIDRSRGHRLD